MRKAGISALAVLLAGSAMPVCAQDTVAEARLRKVEAEVRALQRQVFPGSGDGRVFTPEISATGTARPSGAAPSSTAVSDLLTRMDAVEGQLARLTAQTEQTSNRLNLLEARVGVAAAATPVPAPPVPATATTVVTTTTGGVGTGAPAPVTTTTQTVTAGNLAAMSGGASTPRTSTTTRVVTPTPAPAAGPSAQRLAAVRAIVKPATGDAAEDEYSFGYRLWEAKLFPEAQQQLKMFVDKYPRHQRLSYARNLLGRAFLDDSKPRDAATWFLQNYQAEKTGARAADSLLFLAESMRQLRDTSRACIALAEFADTYAAEAAGRLKSQYDATRAGTKCTG